MGTKHREHRRPNLEHLAARTWPKTTAEYNKRNPQDQLAECTARAIGARALDNLLRGLFKDPEGEALIRSMLTKTEFDTFVKPRLNSQKPNS